MAPSRSRPAWKTLVGWCVLLVGVAAFLWGLWHQIDIGECGGTGKPECPPESNVYIPAVIGGVFASLAGGHLMGAHAVGWLVLLVTTPVMLLAKAFLDRAPGERSGLLVGAGVLVGVVLVGLVVVLRHAGQQVADQRLRARGAKARGRVLRVRSTGLEVNHNPQAELQLRLEPLGGGEPFEVRDTRVVDRLRPPRAGDLVPAWFDAADHGKWTMLLPGPEGFDEATVKEFGLTTAAGEAEGLDDDVARVDALESLVAMRESGALTDAEFEREKLRLLE